jgi:hypothetical protein
MNANETARDTLRVQKGVLCSVQGQDQKVSKRCMSSGCSLLSKHLVVNNPVDEMSLRSMRLGALVWLGTVAPTHIESGSKKHENNQESPHDMTINIKPRFLRGSHWGAWGASSTPRCQDKSFPCRVDTTITTFKATNFPGAVDRKIWFCLFLGVFKTLRHLIVGEDMG